MKKLFQELWNDEGGFIISTEAMILWTIVVLGMVTGLVAVRDASVTELTEVANAILTFDQSYTYQGVILNTNAVGVPGPGLVEAQTNGSNGQDYPGTDGTVTAAPFPFFTLTPTKEAAIASNTGINVISISVP